MSDLKRPIASSKKVAGTKGVSRMGGLQLLNLFAVILSAVLVLLVFLSHVSEVVSINGLFLFAITAILLVALSVTYLVTLKRFRSLKVAQDWAEEQVGTVREEKRKLNHELIGKDQELKANSKEIAKLHEELEDGLRRLEEARQQVQKKSKAKSNFLAAVSHELRTPMNAIMGMIHLLKQSNPREDQCEHLEVLDFSAKSLLALITNVLDFSQIESGKIEVNAVAFNLRNLIDEVVNDFRFMAEDTNISLSTEVEGSIPEKIMGDPTHLSQILSNLLSNALKFTRQGQVRISVKEIKSDGGKCRLLFSIVDTGVGISREYHDRIFDKFTQEQSGNARVFGGAGLGLSICKKLVELQGGKIYLKSEKNIGSSFYVELLFDIPADEQPRPKNSEALLKDYKGATVLLVEDNPVNQTIMRRFLDKWQLQILIAEDGEQALEKIEGEKVSLVLMDLQMPNMDGYEATRLIRLMEDSQKAKTPIIALTAASLQDVKEKALAAGMDDFLTKPFDPEKLQRTLENYMPHSP